MSGSQIGGTDVWVHWEPWEGVWVGGEEERSLHSPGPLRRAETTKTL